MLKMKYRLDHDFLPEFIVNFLILAFNVFARVRQVLPSCNVFFCVFLFNLNTLNYFCHFKRFILKDQTNFIFAHFSSQSSHHLNPSPWEVTSSIHISL